MPGDNVVVYQRDLRVAVTQEQLNHWEVERVEGSTDLLAYGPCPVCGHDCSVRLPMEFVSSAAAVAEGPPPERATRKFPCTCSPAASRPPSEGTRRVRALVPGRGRARRW